MVKSMGGLAAADERRTQPKPPKIGPKLAKPSILRLVGHVEAPVDLRT